MAKEQITKVKSEKKWTRVQAEKALSAGMDPTVFVKHGNYHVRCKAWKKMGRPLPDSFDAQNKFLATLQGKEMPKNAEEQVAFIAALRDKFEVYGETPAEPATI